MINIYQPSLGKEELSAIETVFESNWLGKGDVTAEFEKKFGEHLNVDSKKVLSTNCCSEALFSSMEIFDIGVGDEVILPTCSFVGAANAIVHSGAKIVFCDVDPRTMNVTAENIEKVVTPNTKAILLVHFAGIPCEMDEIMDLANAYGIKVFEDAACGVASKYKGKALGTIGDMGMWSFDAMKILVCADGGMAYFKDQFYRDKAEKIMYFGLENKSGYSNSVDKKWWEFEISQIGHRAIMNDVTAAMAVVQLGKLPKFIERRKQIAKMYDEGLKNVAWLDTPSPLKEYMQTSYYMYHIQVKNGCRDDLAKFLRDNDIYTTFRYFPLHWVKRYGYIGKLPNAEWAALNTLCLPIHQSLSDSDVEKVISKIIEYGGR